jgi:hypothetical protein
VSKWRTFAAAASSNGVNVTGRTSNRAARSADTTSGATSATTAMRAREVDPSGFARSAPAVLSAPNPSACRNADCSTAGGVDATCDFADPIHCSVSCSGVRRDSGSGRP